MSDLISSFLEFFLEIFLEIKFWVKHGKQRKYEKDNNLPKSFVWAPYTIQFVIAFLIIIPIFTLAVFYISVKLKIKIPKYKCHNGY